MCFRQPRTCCSTTGRVKEGWLIMSVPRTPDSRLIHIQIKDFVKQILLDLSKGKLPSVSISKYKICISFSQHDRFRVFEETDNKETLRFQHSGSANRLVMLRVLGIIQKLLEEGKHASKRDIYYTDVAIFRNVQAIDQAINDICIYFHCSRHSLNVVSVSKGLVMGCLSYDDDGRRIDCMKYSCTGISVPVHTHLVRYITSFAEYILLVEKETVFQRLANDGYCRKNRCIVLSGKGYPDIATRSFLRLLKEKLNLPVFALVDGDPYGLDILLTYKFGSLSMAYDAEVLVTPCIYWLGIHFSDCETFGVPKEFLLPLSRPGTSAFVVLSRYLSPRAVLFQLLLNGIDKCHLVFPLFVCSI
ncbi:hypothetical protein KP509_02G042600 [Ceratopteris richardii]|uniref:DNA topoisomerase (ATP-hydrolyzing) n=1 Tax=Ceratopteris richardii TaxID=49495 RepID=A0A8T2VCD2_CERRI|nr:hypothetical protein KP509_02G042600 [Ceratopteris richardii]